MIEVKEATRIALDYVKDVLSTETLYDLALEEVELSEDETHWLVTVGFTRLMSQALEWPISKASAWPSEPALTQTHAVREYRVVDIEADTGKVKSMKMRVHLLTLDRSGWEKLAPILKLAEGKARYEDHDTKIATIEKQSSNDALFLLTKVYEGLSPEEIDEIEQIVLDRSHFFTDREG